MRALQRVTLHKAFQPFDSVYDKIDESLNADSIRTAMELL